MSRSTDARLDEIAALLNQLNRQMTDTLAYVRQILSTMDRVETR